MITVENNKTVSRPRGRPRAFDRDEVLEKAAETFWRLGYEGASISDLTAAMGITPQSLYAAFTSKADLYREALAWYQAHIGASTARALEESDVVSALARVLRESAREFTRPGRPHGCMVSTAVLTCAVENEPVAHHVSSLRGETLDALKARIELGVAEGQLKGATNAAALARFVGAMIQGMSVQAQDGASRATLLEVADIAIAEIERHRL
ncbi:TetR/AcrR family transcriptional regulator [Mesorhizobium huakuii]|uniref:TetR/AcrR family transcriptional regulator n=1 Tax=Mesorhizobium huakuii TaxID=28104 RepID=A0ABZ0VH50_9HYPH|nr:TetR/AcrR family transcriptional regulator [Mesorhizobium huakuii]WQB95981.1 TetR/AcrR family transcriptional regulator [Mesorhizobium huakuii]